MPHRQVVRWFHVRGVVPTLGDSILGPSGYSAGQGADEVSYRMAAFIALDRFVVSLESSHCHTRQNQKRRPIALRRFY